MQKITHKTGIKVDLGITVRSRKKNFESKWKRPSYLSYWSVWLSMNKIVILEGKNELEKIIENV